MAAKGEDNKTGLIASLVGFVLLSIVLGVTTWYGYDGQKALDGAAKEAKSKQDAAEKSRDWYRYQAVQVKKYAGAEMASAEKEAYSTLRERYKSSSLSGDESADMAKLVERWDAKYKDTGLFQRSEALQNDLNRTKAALDAAKVDWDKSKKTYDDERKRLEALADNYKAKMEDTQKALARTNDENTKSLDTRLAKAEEASTTAENLRKTLENDQTKFARDKQASARKLNDAEEQIRKMRDRISPPDLLKFDRPKGKIVSLDARGDMAFINLGSADGVRGAQNLTFSLFGAGVGGQASDIRKGSVEVLEVVGEHLSMAKITDVADPNQNPIVTGDVLINPSWNPNQPEHIAIAGLIDLTGDGRDNIDELMRNLRQQGVIVDEYVDVRDGKKKGPGLNVRTSYLVLGEAPDLSAYTRENDPRRIRNEEIAKLMTEMREQATRLGISIVPLKRFVMLTGYRIPRGAGVGGRGFTFDAINKSSTPSVPPSTPNQE